MKIKHLFVLASLVFSIQVFGETEKEKKSLKRPPVKTSPTPAEKCELSIDATDSMQYQVDGKKLEKIEVPSKCKIFKVSMKHTGKLQKQVMGHNFVLTLTKDAMTVNSEAMKLGPSKDYLPDMKVEPFKSKVIVSADKLIGAGESVIVNIDPKKLKKKEDYTFFCTFPGHFAMMQGKLSLN